MNKNTLGSLLSLSILLIVALACGGSKTPPPAGYVGAWTGADGSTITIRGDGSGDYKSGGTSVSGGSVTIDEGAKTMKIAFAGLGPSFTIDKAPSGGQMTLSGVIYKNASGSSSSSSSSSSSNSSSSTSNSSSNSKKDDKDDDD
ncbi:MAG: hypothetical protein JO314_06130 [Acidobacteria bacterium]|nr:hypothetical protein [Acidobacteriota bacterium]